MKSLLKNRAIFGYSHEKRPGSGANMAARPMDGATCWQLPWTLNKPLQVSPLSGHLARQPIIPASKTALAAQRPESQVQGKIDWHCQSRLTQL